jgi:hypothetical protein
MYSLSKVIGDLLTIAPPSYLVRTVQYAFRVKTRSRPVSALKAMVASFAEFAMRTTPRVSLSHVANAQS